MERVNTDRETYLRGVISHFLDTFFARRSIHHRHRRTPIHPSTLTLPHPHQYLNPWMVTSVKGDRGKGTLHRRTPELGILRTRMGPAQLCKVSVKK